jgi:hypothetical protein
MRFLLGSAWVAALLAAGCDTGSDAPTAATAAGSGGSSATGGAGGSGEGGEAGLPTGAACMPPPLGTPCLSTDYCEPTHSGCLSAGVCRPRPTCSGDGQVACGCDGVKYDSVCDANAHGVAVDDLGACPVPPGKFVCMDRYCDIATEFCGEQAPNVAEHVCEPLPASCMPPTCDCLRTTCVGDIWVCAQAPDGSFTAQCGAFH